jgi:hypothetical protein
LGWTKFVALDATPGFKRVLDAINGIGQSQMRAAAGIGLLFGGHVVIHNGGVIHRHGFVGQHQQVRVYKLARMEPRETQADAGGMGAQAQSVCAVADDIDAARRDWRDDLDDAAAAFKLEGTTTAFEDVRDVWEAEFRVYHEVLQHWCDAAKAASAGYQTVDEYLAAQQRRIPRGVM